MNPINLKAHRPLIIAGPCSAETEQQTIDTCVALAKSGKVDIIRAGIWKPRTNPNSFEGVGERGLAWLAKVKSITGLPFGVEVANAKHLYTALSYGADLVWIGARTTVSPFSVQDIADALHGTDVKVLIKNPMNPDIDLWSGAVKRIALSIGEENIGLIHRGFSFGGHTKYRNTPLWHLVFEMRRRYPDMAMLCDPSHICGCREYLYEVSQGAADMGYDGLIVESHCNPDAALSDASQQLVPADLVKLLDRIKWRDGRGDDPEFVNSLNNCRGEIDRIDEEVFDLLSRRMKVAEQIGCIKRDNNVPILQQGRWQSIIKRSTALASELGLSEEFMITVLNAIHLESINHQNDVMNS